VQQPARPPHPASQVPMAASHARPQPDQPWHKPRFLSSISAAQKAEQPPKQEKLRRVGGKLPQQRERERRFFSAISPHCHTIAFTVQKISGIPSGSAHRIFPVPGVEWRGCGNNDGKANSNPIAGEREKERRKASSVTRKATGTRCSFAPSAVRFLRPSEQQEAPPRLSLIAFVRCFVLGCAFALWSPLARKESLGGRSPCPPPGLFPLRSASLSSVE
jgi:hypothetical protein